MRQRTAGESSRRSAAQGVLVFLAALAACVLVVLHFFPQLQNLPTVITPWAAIRRDGLASLVVLACTWLMARVEHRSVGAYGLSGAHSWRNFAAGLGWGVAMLSLLIGALVATGHLVFAGTALHGVAVPGYALAWILVFFLVAIAEEALFRGYLQSTLARVIGFWPAALLLSVGFGLIHLRSENEVWLGIAMAAMGGLVFSLCLRLSGSLWWGIGFHAAWDWAESFLYGTPDSGYMVEGHWLSSRPLGDAHWSGGSAGPEGSVLVIPVFLVASLVIIGTLKRRVRADRPSMDRGWDPL